MAKTPKTLIVIRHAHRDKPFGREADNGLSEKGWKQAKRIHDRLNKKFDTEKLFLFSSPKVRCIETLEPLARDRRTEIHTSSTLDEGGNLARKAQKAIQDWKNTEEVLTLYCSHGDWIPTFTQSLIGVPIELKKGGWIEFEETRNGQISLRWVLQTL